MGYDVGEPLPDHSSLTRIRARYGVEVFRRFFEEMVDQCQHDGLVWGKELYADATKVQANAAIASLAPRFAVEAHLENLFSEASLQEQKSELEKGEPAAAHLTSPAPAATEMPLRQEQEEAAQQESPSLPHPPPPTRFTRLFTTN